MKHHTHQPNRRSIRLKGYDYTQAGLYFVTLCTHNREGLFGQVANGVMQLNEAGQVVANEWVQTAEIRHEIELDEWVVMPNHLHGIVVITSKDLGIVVGDLGIDLGIVGAHGRAPPQQQPQSGRRAPPQQQQPQSGRRAPPQQQQPQSGRRAPPQQQQQSPLHRPPKSLGSLIAGFKSAATKRINEMRGTPGMPVWQRNYYEHIIRNELSLSRIRNYIANNPQKWQIDSKANP